MNAMPEHAMESPERELVMTHLLDAPRELVFKVWTECEHFTRWWGPREFTTPHCTIDARPGGSLLYCMRSPDGQDYWGKGVYHEVVPPERIVYTDSFADEQGDSVPPSRYGMDPEWPAETLVTVTLEDEGGKTRMTVRYGVPEAMAERTGAKRGWNQSVDRLEAYLAGLR